MNVTFVSPIAATANWTARTLLRPEVPSVAADPGTLQETNLVEFATELARRGHRPTVLFGDVFVEERSWTTPAGVRIEPVPTVMRFPFHPGLLPATPSLLHHPALRDADIVQTGEFHQPSTFLSCLAARDSGAPVVVWQETFRPMRYPGGVYQWAYESTLGGFVRSHASCFVPRTRMARGYLERLRVPDDRLGPWVPTGVDTEAFAPRTSALTAEDFGWPKDSRILLVVARLHPTKGVDVALRTLKWVKRRHPDVRMIVRGSGPERGYLERLARTLGVEDSVEFLRRVSRREMVDLYNFADIVLCPSRMDLLPFSLMEASACARPCVATAAGAIRDIIVDGETGVVVPHAHEEALGPAVSTLLEDGERQVLLGNAARARMMSWFSLPVVADRFLHVYRSAAG